MARCGFELVPEGFRPMRRPGLSRAHRSGVAKLDGYKVIDARGVGLGQQRRMRPARCSATFVTGARGRISSARSSPITVAHFRVLIGDKVISGGVPIEFLRARCTIGPLRRLKESHYAQVTRSGLKVRLTAVKRPRWIT
jgi:hypothetical protein